MTFAFTKYLKIVFFLNGSLNERYYSRLDVNFEGSLAISSKCVGPFKLKGAFTKYFKIVLYLNGILDEIYYSRLDVNMDKLYGMNMEGVKYYCINFLFYD